MKEPDVNDRASVDRLRAGGKQQDEAQVLHYRCGTLPLTVTLTQQQAQLVMNGQSLTLRQEASASGASYSDDTAPSHRRRQRDDRAQPAHNR